MIKSNMTKANYTHFWERLEATMQPKYIALIGIVCVMAYATLKPSMYDAAKVFSTIGGLLSFWALYKYGRTVESNILFRFLWVAIILQLITWTLSIVYTPEWAEPHPTLDYLARWFVFIPFAWWAAQYKNGIWLVWGSSAFSILISPWTTGYGLQEIIDGYYGKRIDFGLRNAQHTTMFFGLILIGLCCFARPLFKKSKLFAIPLGLIIIYCLFVVIASETRQSWLALCISALLTLLYIFHQYTKNLSLRIHLLSLVSFLTIASTLLFATLNNDRISDRVNKESEVIAKLQTLNIDQIPYSSIGIRLHSWLNAIDYIKQKPLFGWGSNGQVIAMTKTQWPENTMPKHIDHLHSHYVETLTNFGVAGLLFYFSIWVVIGRMLFREIKAQKVEKEVGYFFSAVCIFWGSICFFESYLSMWTGVFAFNIFMTGIVGRIWYSKLHPASIV